MNKIAVVILNYNGERLLQQFLPSVIQYSGQASIIVADNGSTDQSVLILETQFPEVALIKLDSVLGVKGTFSSDGSLKAVGLSCAVCHSTVDDAFMPGIGHRLDGWPNRDLNVGQIISLAPDTSALTSIPAWRVNARPGAAGRSR